ncbi:MAG: alpha-L-fucosidase [Clostridia bacterium]|nr:alpha-L-fucosidase [Clostridia bacterium]
MSDIKFFLEKAGRVVPTERQLRHLRETPFYAFVHFSPNTYTGLEWGTGKEDPAIFNPTELDCDEWVEAIKSAGMKGAVITAKHHDGFCLWQTETTEHSIKNSPYKNGKGDIVREFADACRRGGIRFGFYLSPWDRNCDIYGTDEYNDFYRAQLTELLTNYGEVFHVWFDGACGEGPTGKKQIYEFESYFELVRKYQPDATIFKDDGPDIRWCGNESGSARAAEWAVVPWELCSFCEKQTEGKLLDGELKHIGNGDKNIGTLENIIYSDGLVFCPSEIDMSIRPGWFYHPDEEPHSLERLFNTYLRSVGGNTTFNLNIPPMPNGRFDPRDIERLKELGDKIRSSFSVDLCEGAKVTRTSLGGYQCEYLVELGEEKDISFFELGEDITQGQRVESFCIVRRKNGLWEKIFSNFTTIGNKRIIEEDVRCDMFKIVVEASRGEPIINRIAAY